MIIKSVSVLFFTLLSVIGVSQQNADTTKKTNTQPGRLATGTVMHFDNKNCSTQIRVIAPDKKDTTYFIPIGAGLESFDKVGTQITFRYGHLMIRQPLGCSGVPVRIWDVKEVTKKKRRSAKAE